MGSGSINVNMKMTAQKYCQILKAVGPNNALKIDCKCKLLFNYMPPLDTTDNSLMGEYITTVTLKTLLEN